MTKEEVEELIKEWTEWNMHEYEKFGILSSFDYYLVCCCDFEVDEAKKICNEYKDLI